MNDMAATDTISKGIGDSGTEGHDMRHKGGTKQRRMEGYSGVQKGRIIDSMNAMMTRLGCSKQGRLYSAATQ